MSWFGLTDIREDRLYVERSPSADPPLPIQLLFPATLSSVAAARLAVRDFASDLEVDLEGMVLAVSEAVANAVTHAYAGGSRGEIRLSATASPSEVRITVRDRGRGLTEDDATAGAGFGLLIIRRLAQHVELADTRAGVTLTMSFRRASAL
jgi:anti-sigma regulatory factor (Ser/Thr protein kinase)